MSELWMNAPFGYPYADHIEKNDEVGIKRFVMMISGDDKDVQQTAFDMTHPQRIKMLEDSGFTFDVEWIGTRPLPTRPDGVTASALDDPMYLRRNGIGTGN
jgi:hypothetical protein